MSAKVDVAMPSEREIRVTRAFAASAQRIFDFHTKPEYVQKWLLGPAGWSMPTCEIDLRVGGIYRYVWRDTRRDSEFGVRGEYREIAAPQRLVHTENMDGTEGEALCTLTFVEASGNTTLSTTMLFPSKEIRDRALQSGMTDGMSTSYERLASTLEEEP